MDYLKEKIEELIKKVGNQAEYSISSSMGINKKGNKYYCCSGTHKDKNPSMSWNSNDFYFKCFTCGITINIYTFERTFHGYSPKEIFKMYDIEFESNFKNENTKSEKCKPTISNCGSFTKIEEKKIDSNIDFESKDITNDCINYIIKRGISKETINYFKVGSTIDDLIAFNYFDENKKIIGIKKRKPKKISESEKKYKYFAETGSHFNFYNQNNIDKEAKYVFITEGEIDSMALFEAGIKNVVSIPTGANSLIKVIEENNKFLSQFNKIFVWFDNDKYGIECTKKFKDKFKDKIISINYKLMKNCKDINELLFKEGKKEVLKIAKIALLNNKNLINVNDFENEIEEKIIYIPTGFGKIDYALNQLSTGKLTLVTGYTGHGKTCFVETVQNTAIEKGFKILVVDGEHTRKQKIENSYIKLLGRYNELTKNVKINIRELIQSNDIGKIIMHEWHKNKYFLYSSCYESKKKTRSELFELIKRSVEYENIKLIVIDNLMSLNVIESEDKNESQKLFVEDCQNLAKKYNVHIILCCHPKKPQEKNNNNSEYNISGSADIPNYADNIIWVGKNSEEKKQETGYSGYIQILKNRDFSECIKVNTVYDYSTKSIFEVENNQIKQPQFKRFEEIKNKYLNENIDGKTIKEIEDKLIKFENQEDLPWE